jgi:two-component system cell cycle response regulator CpdR
MSHTVLVVDDDPGVLDVMVDMLEELGCKVVSAHSGTDALDRLRQNQDISILITDINMPAWTVMNWPSWPGAAARS